LSGLFFEYLKRFFDESFPVIVSHPSYSPDLVPSDFWLFGHIKTSLVDLALSDVDELLEAVIEF
jgi:hypothetical protein